MNKVHRDEKIFFVTSTRLYPEICSQSWAFVKIHNQIFTMNQLNFCYFKVKNEFLGPKNPYAAIFQHQTALEIELQYYF